MRSTLAVFNYSDNTRKRCVVRSTQARFRRLKRKLKVETLLNAFNISSLERWR
jgi:hypothetical protein